MIWRVPRRQINRHFKLARAAPETDASLRRSHEAVPAGPRTIDFANGPTQPSLQGDTQDHAGSYDAIRG